MGIHGLTKVIADHAPKAIKEGAITSYFGRKVAIDASMSIYQFLIAVRSDGGLLTNEAGETTSHLVGIFYRTIRMLENGIKPIYVFDGKPPAFKALELEKRLERRKEAEAGLAEAAEVGTTEAVEKFNRRLVRVTKQHNEECKQLLSLMGVPFLQAPGEAEAQCSQLVKAGHCYGVGSEDMDTLTFGSPVLLRHMTASEAKKLPISEISLVDTLAGLNMTMAQFIDLCILLGCDYCESIKGIGPHKAIKLVQDHGDLETILANIDPKKYVIPEEWPYPEVRKLFSHPDVMPDLEVQPLLKWTGPREEELVQFMVKEKGFNEDRIRNGIKKLVKCAATATQGRLDSFFFKRKESAPADENGKAKGNSVAHGSKKAKSTATNGPSKK